MIGLEGRGAARLVLGTAQLGLPYGIANQTGQPDRQTAYALLQAALDAGVPCLDTAACYGEAEAVLGAFFARSSHADMRVVTKVDTPPEGAVGAGLADMARAGVTESCRRLGVERLDTLLLREAWPLRAGNAFWTALCDLQAAGVIEHLGLSAQAPDEVLLALDVPAIRHIQLPMNLLDYRWREAGVLAALADRPDVTVHVRSVYLQGLLTAGADIVWPAVAGGCGPAVQAVLNRAVAELGRCSVADLCVAYVLGAPGVDAVVLGVENLTQLDDNLSIVRHPPLAEDERAWLEAQIPRVPVAMLNPSLW